MYGFPKPKKSHSYATLSSYHILGALYHTQVLKQQQSMRCFKCLGRQDEKGDFLVIIFFLEECYSNTLIIYL